MQKLAAVLVFVVLLLGLFLMRESRQEPAEIVDGYFGDWVAANTLRGAPATPIAFVAITDDDLGIDHQWPWSPLDFALFMGAALHFEPAVIALEPVLHWEETAEEVARHQRILHESILRAPKVVLAAKLGHLEDPDIVPPLQQAPVIRNAHGKLDRVPQFSAIIDEPKEQFRLASFIGFTNGTEPGIVARKIPLIFRYQGQVVPSLTLQTAARWLKLTPDEITVVAGSHIALGSNISVPIDGTGAMAVNYNVRMQRFAFSELLTAVEQHQAGAPLIVPAGEMKENVAFLGRTDSGARNLQLPSGRTGAPAEVMAAAMATILGEAFIRRVHWSFDVILIAVAMLLGLFVLNWRKRTVVIGAAAAWAIYLLGAIFLYGKTRMLLPFMLPTGLALFLVSIRLMIPYSARSQPPEKQSGEPPAAPAPE